MAQIFFPSRSAARVCSITGNIVDNGADAPQGKRWAKNVSIVSKCSIQAPAAYAESKQGREAMFKRGELVPVFVKASRKAGITK